jgi:hypothetical protein
MTTSAREKSRKDLMKTESERVHRRQATDIHDSARLIVMTVDSVD